MYPYPLWILAQPRPGHPITNGLSPIPFQWASPVQVEVEDTTRVTTLLTTTELGGRLQAPVSIDATQDWQQVITPDAVRVEPLAVAYADPAGGRLVLAGTAGFIADRVVQGSRSGPAGMIFFQNAVDWLAQDEALITIRSKDRSPPLLVFESEWVRDAARYGNLVGVPLLFILFGMWRLARRRGRQTRRFEAGGALV